VLNACRVETASRGRIDQIKGALTARELPTRQQTYELEKRAIGRCDEE
jgi:hypothetical protein